jgi:alpha-glucosidase
MICIRTFISISISALLLLGMILAKTYTLKSPDQNIRISIAVEKDIRYSVFFKGQPVVQESPIALILDNGLSLGHDPKVSDFRTQKIDDKIVPVIKEKRALILDKCNEMEITFKDQFGLFFRAYNDGVAYRFYTLFNDSITVRSEQATFSFAEEDSIYFPFENSMHTSFEKLYDHVAVSDITSDQMGFLPVFIETANGAKIVLTETDLNDYPGMFIHGAEGKKAVLEGKYALYPIKEKQVGDRQLRVIETADYIARTVGKRSFPWRILLITDTDAKIVESDIVYRLSPPLQIKETAWIKPGKVAWDWWNASNLYNVNFQAALNTETYKYYIDFAHQYNLEYIILDEGWSVPADLTAINPDIDLQELIRYGNSKNVGIILWVVWLTLDRQLEQALDQFALWGIKGVKIDFMDRDDQKMVNFYHKIARETAKRKLLVDFHGAYKPSGLRRAYPNVITREGVRGMEYCKWATDESPEYTVTIPFIRMVAGPMDYTPGAMRNVQARNFAAIFERPMSQGTRCHQLAMFVVYESPLQMLADSPSNYLKETDMMKFLEKVPTVWDQTVVPQAKIADYIVVARQSGEAWYAGAMSDWTGQQLNLDLSFLGAGEFKADIYSDGINADRFAEDYTFTQKIVSNKDALEIKMAPGGGWAARFYAVKK